MNKVSGKVLLKETNVGIPDLLVEIYDVDANMRREQSTDAQESTKISTEQLARWPLSHAMRLSSGVTQADGAFELNYEDTDFRRRNSEKQRPDLLLILRAPEEEPTEGKDGQQKVNILYLSKEIRQDASANEVYVIRMSTAKLQTAGLFAPSNVQLDVDEPQAVIAKVIQNVERQATITDKIHDIASKRVDAQRKQDIELEKEVEALLLEKLTRVTSDLIKTTNFVPPGASGEKVMLERIKQTLQARSEGPPSQGYIVLSKKQADKLMADQKSGKKISVSKMRSLIFGSADNSQRATVLTRKDLAHAIQPSKMPILFPKGETQASNDGTHGNNGADTPRSLVGGNSAAPNGSQGITASPDAKVPDHVNRLLETIMPPEEMVAYGASSTTDKEKPDSDNKDKEEDKNQRPTKETVKKNVEEFNLHTGPADVPALYDFHSLEIAFDYIWQKWIDEEVQENAIELSHLLKDMGGNPLAALKNQMDPVKALRTELRSIERAFASSPMMEIPGKNAIRYAAQGSRNTNTSTGKPLTSKPNPAVTIDEVGAKDKTAHPVERYPHELLQQLEKLLSESFAFDIFVPGSVNFGILVTYRQRWVPQTYQVGNLVKTLTLMPNETRKVTSKRVTKKDRSVKEMENSLRIIKDEMNTTGRAESEIVAKAEAKTNFNMTAKGSYNAGMGSGEVTIVTGKDKAANSSDTKKAFREAVLKAAQEYKDEHKLEIEAKESYEEEVSESIEIKYQNTEMPCTLIFFELQRRFKISEVIYRLCPVVLVAMDVPNPSHRSIDALLLTHGWIIDRVLLDDQFRQPLEYFRTKLVGDEWALREMKGNLDVMRNVVEVLKAGYIKAQQTTIGLADYITAIVAARAKTLSFDIPGGSFTQEVEDKVKAYNMAALQTLEDSARERYDRAVHHERELRAQLDSETAALRSANDDYAKALADHLNTQIDVGSLRLHIKENIFHYMQAIWSHTYKDQLFLQLHKIKVPRLTATEQYTLTEPAEPPASIPVKPGQTVVEFNAKLKFESGLDPEKDFATLAEVADLDNLLGFKGNYLIFPLRQSNALTDFMMMPYVDSELGLRDPDEFGNFTPEEFIAYARELDEEMRKKLEKGGMNEEEKKELEAARDQLENQFRRLLSAPRRAEEEIIVPTNSLYVEALPAAHPILEDFQLMHRGIDVKKVQAEVRKLELENLRYAARILGNEFEDPDIERKLVISSDNQSIIVPASDS